MREFFQIAWRYVLMFLALVVLTVLIAVFVSETLAIVFAVLAGLYPIIYFASKFHVAHLLLGCLAVGAAMISGYALDNYAYWTGGSLEEVDLQEEESLNADFADATVFYFEDAIVRSDIIGQFFNNVPESLTLDSYYLLSPIVSSDWEGDTPVRFWASCYIANFYESSLKECVGEWKKPYLKALREQDQEYYLEAIEAVRAEWDFPIAENPIVVSWVEDPMNKIAATFLEALSVPFYMLVGGLFYAFVVQLMRSILRRKPKTA